MTEDDTSTVTLDSGTPELEHLLLNLTSIPITNCKPQLPKGNRPFAITMEAWEAAMEDIFLQDIGAEVGVNLDKVGTPKAWWLCIRS